MCVWLTKLQPDIKEPLFELSGQPWTCGKTTNEERELFVDD